MTLATVDRLRALPRSLRAAVLDDLERDLGAEAVAALRYDVGF